MPRVIQPGSGKLRLAEARLFLQIRTTANLPVNPFSFSFSFPFGGNKSSLTCEIPRKPSWVGFRQAPEECRELSSHPSAHTYRVYWSSVLNTDLLQALEKSLPAKGSAHLRVSQQSKGVRAARRWKKCREATQAWGLSRKWPSFWKKQLVILCVVVSDRKVQGLLVVCWRWGFTTTHTGLKFESFLSQLLIFLGLQERHQASWEGPSFYTNESLVGAQ